MSLLLANTAQSTVDGAFVAGIVAGVPEEVHESAIGLLGALKELVSSDDVLGTVAQSVKQGWLVRKACRRFWWQCIKCS